jgi:DNA-binding MarR family transcriptional regulator
VDFCGGAIGFRQSVGKKFRHEFGCGIPWSTDYARQEFYLRLQIKSDLVFSTGVSASEVTKISAEPRQVAWRLFLTVHALACRRIDDRLLKADCLSFDDYDVLLTVNEAPDETIRMTDLAEAVLLSNSGMSRRVARLEERGLLHRDQCVEDGRVFRVRLTVLGRSALAQTWKVYRVLIEESFASHLTDEEAWQMGVIFQRILDRIGTKTHRGLLDAGMTDQPRG